jgi:ATP-dependent helicase/DNAse subunit B
MYSILFNEGFLFTAMAKKNARVLTLDRDFFLDKYEEIEGLRECIIKAEEHVEIYGVPICDFKKYSRR